jgi:uncharacterized membrane protein
MSSPRLAQVSGSTAEKTPSRRMPLTRDLQALAALFSTSGTVHLVRPQFFETIVPRALPVPRGLVYASGVAEFACAAGLLHPRTRQAAGWASAALLVAVFPANVQMAVTEGGRAARRTGSRGRYVATLIRLPLQIPLIRTALKATGAIRSAKRG